MDIDKDLEARARSLTDDINARFALYGIEKKCEFGDTLKQIRFLMSMWSFSANQAFELLRNTSLAIIDKQANREINKATKH